MLGFMALGGGNWASTKKRIKPRAVPGGHPGAKLYISISIYIDL